MSLDRISLLRAVDETVFTRFSAWSEMWSTTSNVSASLTARDLAESCESRALVAARSVADGPGAAILTSAIKIGKNKNYSE
jgi:hypothetical protein